MERSAGRDYTAIIYTRPPVPKGWGWSSDSERTALLREQESNCRAYARDRGLQIDSVVVAPYDAPPLDESHVREAGHIIVADLDLLPSMGPIAELCVSSEVHLHEARSATSVTNWRPPRDS